MGNELKLNDIADELLILNKLTIDTLFNLDNCSDCVSLYVFYYKTAKWQKTDTIKANDVYIKKSLKWGVDKIQRTKKTLKEHGLIEIIQRRKKGKIEGWYIRVSYLVTQKKTEDISVNVEESNNTQKQQYPEATSSLEDINALKEVIKSLKKEIEMLKKKEKKSSFDELIESYSKDLEIQILLKEWLKVRKAKRSAMTDRAIQLNLNKLDKLAKESKMNVKTYLEEVIARGWAAFYAINNFAKKEQKPVREEIVPDWLDKKIEKEPMTPEELAEMEELMKKYKEPESEGVPRPSFEERKKALEKRLKEKYRKKKSL